MRPVWRGFSDAMAGLPAIWRARRVVQAGRRASIRQIAGALNWMPWRLIGRTAPALRAASERRKPV
jgi:hypothetical protein